MYFEFNRYSALLFVFFLHGLVYAFLLFRKGSVNETRSEKWLAAFLILCVLYIAPWMLGFGGWYDTQPYRDILFYVPFQHLYFIGPVIFFYVQSLLNPSFRFGRKEWLHLLPGILYLLFSIAMVVTDKLVLKKYFFLANGEDPDFDAWYQLTGLLSMLIYFFLSLRYYTLYKKLMVQVISYADLVMFRWVRNFLLAFLVSILFRVSFHIADLVSPGTYISSWWYFLLFAIIFYYIAITGYANAVETRVSFKPNLMTYRPALLLQPGMDTNDGALPVADAEVIEIIAVPNNPLIAEELQAWKEKLILLMLKERLYEDPELTLSRVAGLLRTNPSLVSRVINQGFGINFNDFVNQYRIEAVKEMLGRGEHQNQTLLGIAFECGFNSKATFNRAFKKATGQSPKEWLEKNNGTDQ